MNQILFDKKENSKKSYIFKFQFILSIILAIILIIMIFYIYNEEESLENISKTIDKNLELSSIYNTTKTTATENLYFGRIKIDKIGLEYSIFNNYNEELLKISPCKFFGVEFEEKGNICIAAHNYNDDRFFGRVDELEVKDIIVLEDLTGKEFSYMVYDIFETEEDDLSILKAKKNYELTLLTCNNSNKKRIIIKAYRKEY